MRLTWKDIFDSVCLILVESEQRNSEMDELFGFQFLEIWGESAPFEAASILVPGHKGASLDEVKMAKAFMKCMAFMANEWYDYNSSLPESLIPELRKVPKSCRCLPRCLNTCSATVEK